MKPQRICLPLALVLVAASVAGCHNSEPASTTAPAPPPPASVQQNGIQMQEYQINHSNLPPDQKQRLLSQLRENGAK